MPPKVEPKSRSKASSGDRESDQFEEVQVPRKSEADDNSRRQEAPEKTDAEIAAEEAAARELESKRQLEEVSGVFGGLHCSSELATAFSRRDESVTVPQPYQFWKYKSSRFAKYGRL